MIRADASPKIRQKLPPNSSNFRNKSNLRYIKDPDLLLTLGLDYVQASMLVEDAIALTRMGAPGGYLEASIHLQFPL